MIKSEIVTMCQQLKQCGIFVGTWGNISVKEGEKIYLTPSRIAYDEMTTTDIVGINLEGDITEGNRTPTSEREIHRLLYVQDDSRGAVIHTHTPNAIAVSCLKIDEVPCLFEEMSQLIGGVIPLTKEYVPAEKHSYLAEKVCDVMKGKNASIIRNHGAICVGRDLKEAYLVSQIVERACSVFLSICNLDYNTIEKKYIESEHYRYLYKYGSEK